MTLSRTRFVALAVGTTVTLLSMRIGLSLLRQGRGESRESEESLWITSHGDLGELPLEESRCFRNSLRGAGQVTSERVEEFRRILRDATAEETFAHLANIGPGGARLYGLCGLKTLRSTQLSHYMTVAAADEQNVALRSGCTIHVERVREAVRDPGFWAMCETLPGAELPNKALQTDGASRRR